LRHRCSYRERREKPVAAVECELGRGDQANTFAAPALVKKRLSPRNFSTETHDHREPISPSVKKNRERKPAAAAVLGLHHHWSAVWSRMAARTCTSLSWRRWVEKTADSDPISHRRSLLAAGPPAWIHGLTPAVTSIGGLGVLPGLAERDCGFIWVSRVLVSLE
jgi:hypothetical protein